MGTVGGLEKRLLRVEVEDFRSLRKVSLPLGPLNVLVGPNGAGKTNLLEVFRFLGDVIRTDLQPALDLHGRFDELVFRGGERPPTHIQIKLSATWTPHSSRDTPDEYTLRLSRHQRGLSRRETFQFKRSQGRVRRIAVHGQKVSVVDTGRGGGEQEIGINAMSSGLSTLPRLVDDRGGSEVSTLAERIASFRLFDVRVDAARMPSRILNSGDDSLRDDAGNLAGFLLALGNKHPGALRLLIDDAKAVLPQLQDIRFEHLEGAAGGVVITLRERGLRQATQLADASYGTIRLLGLLAMLYDPNPPSLTCVEEIDHGLHPQALELLVERLREASERSQFIIVTHSPTLADRLRPEELVICERRDDGSSMMPAVLVEDIKRIVKQSEGLPLGELWFSGTLGGDL